MKSGILLFMCISLCLVGCKTRTEYVPVESKVETRDSVVIRDSIVERTVINKLDSTVIKDSTVIILDDKGNVIRTELYREKEHFRELDVDYRILQARFDSLLSEKSKTIAVPYPVEKQLTRWQQFKMDVGGYALGLSLIAGIIGLSYCVRWLIRLKR